MASPVAEHHYDIDEGDGPIYRIGEEGEPDRVWIVFPLDAVAVHAKEARELVRRANAFPALVKALEIALLNQGSIPGQQLQFLHDTYEMALREGTAGE